MSLRWISFLFVVNMFVRRDAPLRGAWGGEGSTEQRREAAQNSAGASQHKAVAVGRAGHIGPSARSDVRTRQNGLGNPDRTDLQQNRSAAGVVIRTNLNHESESHTFPSPRPSGTTTYWSTSARMLALGICEISFNSNGAIVDH